MRKSKIKMLIYPLVILYTLTLMQTNLTKAYTGSGETKFEVIESEQKAYLKQISNQTESKHAYNPFDEKKDNKPNNMGGTGFRDDRILVKLDDSEVYRGVALNSREGIKSLQPIFSENVTNYRGLSSSSSIRQSTAKWYKAYLNEGADVLETIEALSKDSTVLEVQPDYLRALSEIGLPDPSTDEKMNEQWYLENLGMKEAWAYLGEQGINPGGSRDIVVAVIDTGVDYNHPDLVGNMWTNTGEIPGNNIDDDNNGYIDDIHGANTVGNRYSGESGDPMDDHGHGTHVAGIIAAAANNNEGGVGIAYNVQIMAVKAAQSSGILTSSDIAQAVEYAYRMGADVINMSFGGYGQSIVEEDALQNAFGTSVLVAAAGNDGLPNRPYPIIGKDMFPAAYPWVLGVMAENQYPSQNGDYIANFSNWDYIAEDSHEYQVMAPGVEILSTLPGGKYAKWSGTSMATPIVSGIAALVRSKFKDKNLYSSRFIMGQVASTGKVKQGVTYDPKKPSIEYYEVNAFNALSNVPKPKVSYLEHYIFDSAGINSGNNGDGVADAGEIIDIGMVIRNHWGKADNVKVQLDTKAGAGIEDKYVTFLNGMDTVNYGAVGTFDTDDNGFIYDNDVLTGITHPFKLKIADNCPNDHVVPINITITATDGLDSNGKTVYTSYITGVNFAVRNGQKLPGVISTDMTLTKDKYWIVPNATVIEKGAKVTVEPGTQIQFWNSEPDDPYAEQTMAYIDVKGSFIVNGTSEDPVELFASGLYPGFEVKIFNREGYSELKYAKVMNPNISVNIVDHCYFSQDLFDTMYTRYLSDGNVWTSSYEAPRVNAEEIRNSRFYQMGVRYNPLYITGKSIGNLFDSCKYNMNSNFAEDNVYLKNYKLDGQQYGDRNYWTSNGKNFGFSINEDNALQIIFPIKNNENGSVYFILKPNAIDTGYEQMKFTEEYVKGIGGHIATINDAKENQFIAYYINNYLSNKDLFASTYPNLSYNSFFQNDWSTPTPIIGLNDFYQEGSYKWLNDEDSQYRNWRSEEPNSKGYYYSSNIDETADFVRIDSSGNWFDEGFNTPFGFYYLIEVPGNIYVTGISLDNKSLTLGAGGASAKITATITPVGAANKNIKWASSNSDVASVDENGVVTPIKIGTAIITATAEDGGYTDSCTVMVREIVRTTGVSLNKASMKLVQGNMETLIATISPAESTNKNLIWKSSNKDVASIDDRGNVTGVSLGDAVISVETEDGGYTASCNVSVVQPVTGVTLDTGFLRLVDGESSTSLKANIQPADASIKDVNWTSSNTSVATVNQNGEVTPVGVGTALITVITVDGEYTANCIVTVWEHEVEFKTTAVSAGYDHTLAVNNDGTVWAWGNNEYNKLGDGSSINRYTPVKVKNLSDVKAVSAGYRHSMALKNDGTVWTWGYNGSGQLGNGDRYGDVSIPTQVVDLTDVVAIAAGRDHSIALKSDGTVWTWGYNYYAQLGDGTKIDRIRPIQVQNLTDVKEIAAAYYHSIVLKKDGTVWSWGYNPNGQLGNGTNQESLIPAQVKNIHGVKSISAGQESSFAIKTDGSVWRWGYIWSQGIEKLPVQELNIQGVENISVGYNHVIALQKDGTIWTWGYNNNGQLGDGTYDSTSSPVQVKDINEVLSIEAGFYHTAAVKSDGTIMSWGNNNFGQLGDLSTENRNTPVQTLFGILPDDEAPQITDVSPTNNSINVPVNTNIVFTFSEAVKTGDNFGLITLKDSNNKIISLKKKSISGNILTIEPINALTANTGYSLYIPEGSVKDMFNNNLSSSYTLSFTTEGGMQANGIAITGQSISNESEIMIESFNSGIFLLGSSLPPNVIMEVTQEDLDKSRQEFIAAGNLSTIRNNAILNRWWDPDVNHWMRFTSNEGEGNKRYLANNYWGTNSETLIGKALVDFNDFRNMEEIVYKPILTTPPDTAYPFVTDIYVSTETEERATKVGAEKITVHVNFNRDMNTTIQPQVSFGPDMPTTDYTVNAVNGGWLNARHWVGEFNVSPLTGDGYQFFRVAGAVAADDPWLVTGNDSERFRFEIITSGTEAMHLQAEGAEGKISLSWTQDDFDLLAGYNVYRSTAPDSGFQKINKGLIPSEQKYFEDTTVEPGKLYFYKFTVINTDLTESAYSNVAWAAAFDTVPPVISHETVRSAAAGLQLRIYADITDNVRVQSANLYYRKTGSTDFLKKEMIKSSGNQYSVILEGNIIQAPGLEYYIEANDGTSIVRNGTPNKPNKVDVTDSPKITSISPSEGTEKGGTTVIITGSNFKDDASVTFGGAVASNVVVESANRISAVTPANIPGTVDVAVINKDGFKDIFLRGYTFKKVGVEVSIPDAKANKGQTFEVPVNILNVTGLNSVDLKITFDKEVLKVNSIRAGNITSGFASSFNYNTPGEAVISMASLDVKAGSGTIAYIEFEVLNTSKSSSVMALNDVRLNSGSIIVDKVNGTFNLSLTHKVSGNINYYFGGKAVSGVNLSIKGDKTYSGDSNASGQYSIQDVEDGNYVLYASKSNETEGISSLDASRILQASTGLITLNDYQKKAADVDGSGRVDAADAAYVLQRSAGVIQLPFQGSGEVWSFAPSKIDLAMSSNDIYNQNLTAILKGDVTGNWGTGVAEAQHNYITAQDNSNGTAEFSIGEKLVRPGEKITIPLTISLNHAEIYGIDIEIKYDADVIKVVSVDKTNLTDGFNVVSNIETPGIIKVAMAGAQPVTNNGQLLNINFEAVGSSGLSTIIKLNKAEINEGAVKALGYDGKITIQESVGVTGVSLDKEEAVIKKGKGIQLNASVMPENAENKNIVWTSDNTKVATVDDKGFVTGKATGIANITASTADGQFTANCKAFVTSSGTIVKAEDIKLDKNSLILSWSPSSRKGQYVTLKSTITPSKATYKDVLWTTSNEKVAIVDNKGKVTSTGAGEAVITAATADGSLIAECHVRVTDKAVSKLSINPSKLDMVTTQKYQLEAEITPIDAEFADLIWTSSKPEVVTVDANGIVTALKKGTATITAETVYGAKKATCSITVAPAIELSKSSVSMKVGKYQSLTARLSKTLADSKIIWQSSNGESALVTEGGRVIAVKDGSSVITASVVVREGNEEKVYSAECSITVSKLPQGTMDYKITKINFTNKNIKDNSLELSRGKSITITTSLETAISKKKPTNPNLIWKSSNPEIAIVDDKGKITAKAKGDIEITAHATDGSGVIKKLYLSVN